MIKVNADIQKWDKGQLERERVGGGAGGGREKQKKKRQITKSEEDTVSEHTTKHQEQTIKREKKRKEVKVRQRSKLIPDVCQQSCKIIQLCRDRGVLLQVLSQILIRSSEHSVA